MKQLAILSGEQCSVDVLIVPEDFDFKKARNQRDDWYKSVYGPAYEYWQNNFSYHDPDFHRNKPQFYSLTDYFIRFCGCKIDEEIMVVEE